MSGGDAVAALVELGFTALEAETYTFLLGEPGVTGYRIAQGIGKPVANTYKALESLQKKGAVLIDEDENRLCSAVPADELLAQLERGFAASRAQAARSLAELGQAADSDDRVYRLRTAGQALERARAMLGRARRVVLIDVFPGALAAIAGDIEAATRRGVVVAVKAYFPASVEGADIYVEPTGDRVIERWSGEWLNLVVDGAEHLLAFFTHGLVGIYQAIWSGSPYISWVYHSALAAEIVMAEVREAGTSPRLKKALAGLDRLLDIEVPGSQALSERFGLGKRSVRKVEGSR